MSIAMASIMLLSLCAVCVSTGVSAATQANTAANSKAQSTTSPNPVSVPIAAGKASSAVGNSISHGPQPGLAGAPVAVDNTSNSRARGPTSADLVGSPIAAGTGPSACVLNGSTSMYVFVKGYDGALWYRIWSLTTYTWTGSWVSLGGQLTSSPAATSTTESGFAAIEVYVRGTTGAVYGKEYWQGAWMSGWYQPGGNGGQVAPGTGPGTASMNNRIDIYVEGTTGAMYNYTWTAASGWGTWQNRGGVLTSSPAAVWRDTFIDVYVRGSNGAIYGDECYYPSNSWTWYLVGGQAAAGTGPTVCTYGSIAADTSRLDLFVQGTTGAMYNRTWYMPTGWSPNWVNQGGALSASPGAATFTFGGAIDIEVFARGTNGLIYQKEFFDGQWFSWMSGIQGPP